MNRLSPLVLFAALAITFPCRAMAPNSLGERQIRDIDALVAKFMTDQHIPGGSFAIGLGGRVVWTKGYGLADVENGVPATADTAYRTASIGKSMTATAAMKLAEEGRLDLDAPIQKYCPRFPPKEWPITARDLISHTSGIRHYEGPNKQAELYNTKHYDHVSDALEIFDKDPLKQRPGTDFLYSTWGYVTLGCVLEGASGEEYRALMTRMIFVPSGMTHTRDDDPAAVIPHRARGYYIGEDGQLRNSRWADMSSKLPAGGWVTTMPDLVNYMNAWMAGKLVSPTSMTTMLTPYKLPRHGGTVDQFGMGWFLDDYHGMKTGLFGGGTPQVSAIVFFVPDKRLAIAGAFDLDDVPAYKRIALAEAVGDVVLGEKTPNPDRFAPAPAH
jgi:serine beta-lactamase-like protein LACTB